MCDRIGSIGSGVPMIPVEQTSTWLFATCSASPAAAAINCAFLYPGLPVPALALPELTTTAEAMPPLAFSVERSSSTGGAANLFWVNTAAQGTGRRSSVAIIAMSNLRFLIPAWRPAATKPSAAVTLMDKLRWW